MSNSESSNTQHWNKIFKHAHSGNNYKIEQVKCEYLNKFIKNKLDNSESLDSESCTTELSINNLDIFKFDDSLFKKENERYFSICEGKNILAKEIYLCILREVSNLKLKLIQLNDYIKNKEKSDDFYDKFKSLIKKEYNDLINFFYHNINSFTKMYLIDGNGNKITMMTHEKKFERNINLFYADSLDIIENECISKIDNIYVGKSDEKMFIRIGKLRFEIKKLESIKDFNIINLTDAILNILDNIYLVEKEINKNIKIINFSIELIKVVENSF